MSSKYTPQDKSFARDRQAFLSALREDPAMDLSNGELLWKIIAKKNPNYHFIATGAGFMWCRTTDIQCPQDHVDFDENKDFFVDVTLFVVFLLEQLKAYGDEMDRILT